MSSMFRLLRGEMHKILMRPILYVITGVLVLALFFSVTLLSMTNRSTTEYTIAGDTKDVVMQNYLVTIMCCGHFSAHFPQPLHFS